MQCERIEKLQVFNFRNLENMPMEFSTGINCILGENGNGKTNVLEAIHFLARRKSFRKNTSFPQLLSFDGEKPEIIISAVLVDEENRKESYSARISQGKNEWFLGGRTCKKKPKLEVLFISPFDAGSFHGLPAFRRTWFDQHISSLDEHYKKNLSRYNQALKQRNSLLSKKPANFREQIKSLDEQLAEYSVMLTKGRLAFIEEIKEYFSQVFFNIFSEEHTMEIQLETKIELSSDSVFKMLQENLPKDEIIGHTKYGVHKDDYTLLFDGLNAFEYCSLGQQKMAYLSLLFAYIELFRYKFISFPVVLIDDISGELDRLRWGKLVSYLDACEFQVLITTANDKFREELEKINRAKKLFVEAGVVREL